MPKPQSFLSALLAAARTSTGSVLKPETLALMFEPHYQPDPRIPGMGLGFFRDEIGVHRTVGYDGMALSRRPKHA